MWFSRIYSDSELFGVTMELWETKTHLLTLGTIGPDERQIPVEKDWPNIFVSQRKTDYGLHKLYSFLDRELWLELNKQRRSKMRRSRSWPLLSDSSEPDLMPMNDQITNNQRTLQSFDGSRSMFISQRQGIFYSFDEDSVEVQEFPASIQRQARRSTRRRKLGLFYSYVHCLRKYLIGIASDPFVYTFSQASSGRT